MLTEIGRKCRVVLRRMRGVDAEIRGTRAGLFQPYNHTMPDRYPWLFEFAAERLAGVSAARILSFGCSRGDEVFSLRRYFPDAAIHGIDIDPANVAHCLRRARAQRSAGMTFAAAATLLDEPSGYFDAIFCLAVLCHGDLTATRAQRCDHLLRFEDFERTVADFARCLKPGGLLLLHTTNFRFCDTAAAGDFDAVLEADPAHLEQDALFDRHNRLMEGARYPSVAFRKHGIADPAHPDAAAHQGS